ncbi:MAG: site-2 protease family protein [Elusimicrobiota bacterium]
MEWIIQLPILFFSVMVHEVCHGWVALRNGDDTARRAGRLTFNPIAHVDPVGSVILPLFCYFSQLPMIGWAKPVPIDPARLLGARRWALFRVALVGPMSNLGLGLCAAIAFRVTAGGLGMFPRFQGTLLNALVFAVSINVFLAFFNLLPVHPLDGSKVMSGLLSARYRRAYERHRPYGTAIIIGLMAFGLLGPLVNFPSRIVFSLLSRLGLIW